MGDINPRPYEAQPHRWAFNLNKCCCCRLWADSFNRASIGSYYDYHDFSSSAWDFGSSVAGTGYSIVSDMVNCTTTNKYIRPKHASGEPLPTPEFPGAGGFGGLTQYCGHAVEYDMDTDGVAVCKLGSYAFKTDSAGNFDIATFNSGSWTTVQRAALGAPPWHVRILGDFYHGWYGVWIDGDPLIGITNSNLANHPTEYKMWAPAWYLESGTYFDLDNYELLRAGTLNHDDALALRRYYKVCPRYGSFSFFPIGNPSPDELQVDLAGYDSGVHTIDGTHVLTRVVGAELTTDPDYTAAVANGVFFDFAGGMSNICAVYRLDSGGFGGNNATMWLRFGYGFSFLSGSFEAMDIAFSNASNALDASTKGLLTGSSPTVARGIYPYASGTLWDTEIHETVGGGTIDIIRP